MPKEDFTTYTEEDPNTRLSQTTDRASFAGLVRNEDAWLVKDKTADYFDGDFEHLLDINIASADVASSVIVWALANLVTTWMGIYNANGDLLYIYTWGAAENYTIQLGELDGGAYIYANSAALSYNTTYYLKIRRDEDAGTYGTLYCDIYPTAADRSAGTNLIETLTRTLHGSKKDFRYIYGTQGEDSGAAQAQTGYCENLILTTAYTLTAAVGAFILTGIAAILIKGFTLVAAVGAFTLTGIAAIITSARSIACSVGSFTLTGIAVSFTRALKMTVAVGEFTLTGIATTFTKALKMAAGVGSFTLTGINVALKRGWKMAVSVGQFILTGIVVRLRASAFLSRVSKPTTSFTKQLKPTEGFTKEAKPLGGWSKQPKP